MRASGWRDAMPVAPETEPLPAHVDAVLRHVVQPRLDQLSQELRHPLGMTVALMRAGMVVGSAPALSAAAGAGAPQLGELQLKFKQVFHRDSRLFQAEARFAPDGRTPAFSGFSIEGHVTSTGDTVTMLVGAWTVLRDAQQRA